MTQNAKLHPAIIPLMAVAAGVTVANIYYNQPILKDISQSIHATDAEIGKVAMFSQLGYGLGMFFLIPLGDKVNRKRLLLLLCGLLILTLTCFTFANNLYEI